MANKKETFSTPAGIAKYAWLNKPNTKFKPNGEYTVDLLLPANDPATEALIGKLNELTDKAFNDFYNKAKPSVKKEMRKHFPYKEERDPETDEPTGNLIFRFHTEAQYKDKKTEQMVDRTVPKFDKYGKPLSNDVTIYRGSVIKVSFNPGPFFNNSSNKAGITLYLQAVLVKELAEYNSAAGYGFDVEESTEIDKPPFTPDSGQEDDDF